MINKSLWVVLLLGITSTTAEAEVVLDSIENIVAAMETCVEIVTELDLAAGDPDIGTQWTRIGSFSGTLQPSPQDLTTLFANINAKAENGYCDLVFGTEANAQSSYDIFIANREIETFEDHDGICHNDNFLAVRLDNEKKYITIHNSPKYTTDPCAD
jgi:hypothetical protein